MGDGMSYVITDKCVAVCDTACVTVCPVDAIHGSLQVAAALALPPAERTQMFIDPDICICCEACESACPVGAIYDESSVPAEHAAAIEKNAAFFRGK